MSISALLSVQVHDKSDLSCSNGGNASVNIVHTAGSLPNSTAYDTYVREVDDSDEGAFEYVITDLTPGNVSKRLGILSLYSCLVAEDREKEPVSTIAYFPLTWRDTGQESPVGMGSMTCWCRT